MSPPAVEELSQANTDLPGFQVKADRGEVEYDKAFQEHEKQKAKKAKST